MGRRGCILIVLAALLVSGKAPTADQPPTTEPVAIITTVAGNGQPSYSSDGGPATKASLDMPSGLATAPDGSLYIADTNNQAIRKIDPAGVITTVAGIGVFDYRGDGGPAINACLFMPYGVAVARDGSLYIADTYNHRVRKVDPQGIIATVAGDGGTRTERPPGATFFPRPHDGMPATKAGLSPTAIAVAKDKSLLIADDGFDCVYRVARDGTIAKVAGNRRAGFGGDGGPATKARLSFPKGLAVAPDGSLYIADSGNHRVRKVDRKGTIRTVAGDGWTNDDQDHTGRYAGDGGPATKASLRSPRGLAFGPDGSLYICDSGNHRIRRVDPKGVITTVVGDGWSEEHGWGRFTGDGGPPTKASLNRPSGVAVGPDGSLYIADSGNHRIRKVTWKK